MPNLSVSEAKQIKKLHITTSSTANALNGDVDLKDFTNIEDIDFNNQRIQSLSNYYPEQLVKLKLTNCEVKQPLPVFSSALTDLDVSNMISTFGSSFEGDLRVAISKSTSLSVVDFGSPKSATVKHAISGRLPIFADYTSLTRFDVNYCELIDGELTTLKNNTSLVTFNISGTGIESIDDNFEFPNNTTTLAEFSIQDCPNLSSDDINRVVDAFHARWGSVSGVNNRTANIGNSEDLTASSFTKLATLRSNGWTINVNTNTSARLLNTNYGKDATGAYSLTKLKANADKAVRVRRAADNIEADVYFDVNGEISNESEIAVISGTGVTGASTTAKTIYEFANETIRFDDVNTLPTGATGSSYNKYNNLSISRNADTTFNASWEGTADATDTATPPNANLARIVIPIIRPLKEHEGDFTRLKFTFTINSYTDPDDNPNSGGLSIAGINFPGSSGLAGSNIASLPRSTVSGEPESFATRGQIMNVPEIPVGNTGDFTIFRHAANHNLGGTQSNTQFLCLALGKLETISISNFKCEAIKHTLFVSTWYDQSDLGNNLTGDTIRHQPKLMEDGEFIKDAGNKPTLYFTERNPGDSTGIEVFADKLKGEAGKGIITADHSSANFAFVAIVEPLYLNKTRSSSSYAQFHHTVGYLGGTAQDGQTRGSSLFFVNNGTGSDALRNTDLAMSHGDGVGDHHTRVNGVTANDSVKVVDAYWKQNTTKIIGTNGDYSNASTNVGTTTFTANTSADKLTIGSIGGNGTSTGDYPSMFLREFISYVNIDKTPYKEAISDEVKSRQGIS